jgi:FKBP-type peptidyl-prolyl cis-trans isomerase FkpA
LRTLQLSPAEIEIVKRGFAEALASPKPLPPPADQAGFEAFVRQRFEAAAAANKESGKAFAAKAAAEKGAQKTASGAIYKPLNDGSGASPQSTDIVKVKLRGTLTDGTVFDGGADTSALAMDRALPCLSEGIAKMKPGGKARLVCPSDTAFGDQGRPPTIPPGATLVFDVALISAQAAPAMAGHGGGLPPGHPPMDAPAPSSSNKPAGAKKK